MQWKNFVTLVVKLKFRRRDARGNLTSAQLRRLGISSASASPCSMLIQHRFAFLNLRPSLRIDESQEELSVPQSRDCKQKIVSLARHRRPAGRDPTVPQSRDWSPKAKCFKAAAESGVPGFSFMHLHALHGEAVFVFTPCTLQPSRSRGIKLYCLFFVSFRAFRG